MQKIRIGVLMGGKSREREVSFNSGRTICDHLDTACYDILPLFQTRSGTLYILPWSFLHRGKISDFEHRLSKEANQILWDDLKKIVDFIYIAMHGQYAEDGTMQGMLELLQIPYFGSKVFASALGMDKIMQKKFLQLHNVCVPRDVVIFRHEPLDKNSILKKITAHGLFFPLIVKPAKEGSSIGTSVVSTDDELLAAINKARMVNQKTQEVLIEEKIEGMEFSCIVLTDENNNFVPLPPTEIVIHSDIGFHDYDQKYMPGKSLQYTPARCTKEQQSKIHETCLQVMRALQFTNLGRIDGFLTSDDKVIIIDPNSFSGAAPSSFLFKQAAEINFNHTQLINHFIKTELKNYQLGKEVSTNSNVSEKRKKKIRVAILMGGNSEEKEISLESGRNITYKLSPQDYEAIPLFLSENLELFRLNARMLVSNSTKEVEAFCKQAVKIAWHELPSIADFVFIALHGGYGENGCVQGALELLGLPYNGSSVLTSALCMNKYKTNQFLLHQGFDVPVGKAIIHDEWRNNKKEFLETIKKQIKFPYIVKPSDSGCSVGVKKVTNQKEMIDAMEAVFSLGKKEALVEECIEGMELTVGVIGNETPQALPPSQAISQQNILSIEEKFLPGAGENQTPAPLPKETLLFVQKTVENAYKALNCKGYARVDCFYQTAKESPTKKERIVIIEFNTLPGMTPATCIFHQAAEIGLKPMDFIDLIIKLGLQEHHHEYFEKFSDDMPQTSLATINTPAL